MHIDRVNATRRGLILAGSAQALLGLNPSIAFGQSTSPALSPGQEETLNQTIKEFNFARASEFSKVFNQLFSTKIALSLAIVDAKAQNTLDEVPSNCS